MPRVVLLGLLAASFLAASCIADRKGKGTSENNVGVVREHLSKASTIGNVMEKLTATPNHMKIAYALLVLFIGMSHSKILLWLRGMMCFVLWGEKKGFNKVPDAKKVVAPKGGDMDSKIVIFIRHGESDWNYIFNKSKFLLLPRLLMGVLWEAVMFVFKNSLFIDSPLSPEGVDQAKKLQRFIADYKRSPGTSMEVDELMKVLRGDSGALDSALVSSPLRRAIATGCIGMYPRLKGTDEKIIMHTSLQEASRNVDTMALAGKNQLPESAIMREVLGGTFKAKNCIDASEYAGSKVLKSTAVKRMDEFCGWCFNRPEPVIIVSASHSLWARNFFKIYLPKSSDHAAKNYKMLNCSTVAFTIEKGVMDYDSHQIGYRVDESSITPMYLGFEKVKCEMKETPKMMLPTKGSSAKKNGQKETNGSSGKNGKEESNSFTCCTGRGSK